MISALGKNPSSDEIKLKDLQNLKKTTKHLSDKFFERIQNWSKQKTNPDKTPILEKVFENACLENKTNYKILVLGSTGAGKTSFLNLFANVNQVKEGNDTSILKSLIPINKSSIENPTGGKM